MIRVSSPALLGNEKRYVNEALDKGDLAIGEFLPRFERAFADTTNTAHAVSCNSGTSALILALQAIGLEQGDEVIVPAITYIATANAVKYFGATPVIVDVDPERWCLDPDAVAKAITNKTKAVIPVHLYGQPAPMGAIYSVVDSSRQHIRVVEDAAEAHGALYRGKPVGGLGDIGCFSFYGNKIITTGEGGMAVTNTREFATRMVNYRDGYTHGRRYYHNGVGFNFRMSNLTAALGLGQLERLGEHLSHRAEIDNWYREMLNQDGIKFQNHVKWATPAAWMTTVLLDGFYRRDNVMQELHDAGIETRPTFVALHRQPCLDGPAHLPVSEMVADQGINLPTHVNLSFKDVEYVCDTLKRILRSHLGPCL